MRVAATTEDDGKVAANEFAGAATTLIWPGGIQSRGSVRAGPFCSIGS